MRASSRTDVRPDHFKRAFPRDARIIPDPSYDERLMHSEPPEPPAIPPERTPGRCVSARGLGDSTRSLLRNKLAIGRERKKSEEWKAESGGMRRRVDFQSATIYVRTISQTIHAGWKPTRRITQHRIVKQDMKPDNFQKNSSTTTSCGRADPAPQDVPT